MTAALLLAWRVWGPNARLESMPPGREVIDDRPLPAGAFARLDADPYVGPVARVLFSPDGKYLAAAMNDKSIRVWSVARRKLLYEIPDAAGQHSHSRRTVGLWRPAPRFIGTPGRHVKMLSYG